MVADGEEPKRIAQRFGRSFHWLQKACIEHGVRLTSAGPGQPPNRALFVVADLQNNPADTYQAVADRSGVTRQRVHQIHVEAIGCGVHFPGRRIPAVKPQPADPAAKRRRRDSWGTCRAVATAVVSSIPSSQPVRAPSPLTQLQTSPTLTSTRPGRVLTIRFVPASRRPPLEPPSSS